MGLDIRAEEKIGSAFLLKCVTLGVETVEVMVLMSR